MGKANKYAKQAAALQKMGTTITGGKKSASIIPSAPPVNMIALSVPGHQFRVFRDMIDDARIRDYPKYEDIPEQFRSRGNVWYNRASKWFHLGGSLSELGIDYNTPEGVNARDYWVSVRCAMHCLLQSFEPSHDHKMATAAWCMSCWYKEV